MTSDVLTQPVQDEQFDQIVETANEEQALLPTQQEESQPVCDSTEISSTLTKDELLALLTKSLEQNSIEELKLITESIKSAFYRRAKSDFEAARKEFVDGGGNPEEFKMETTDHEIQLKERLSIYRQMRNDQTQKQEQIKQQNLELKHQLIERLKQLIEKSENSSESTYPELLEIQKQWREIGAIPKEQVNDVWSAYHFQVENYYNIIKINKELRDLDLKKNLEQKISLCEEAEKLSLSPSFVESFRLLQLLHDKWREVGPVPKENKDEIWDRFKQASSIINKNHQQYFEELNKQQEANLAIKSDLCHKVEAIVENLPLDARQWDTQTKEILNIQGIWRTIGFAPKKDNNRIYERFKSLCNLFFEKKQDFYKSQRAQSDAIVAQKMEISRMAQTLKDSTDWAKTTNELISLQKRWKELKGVSSKDLDQAWKEFRGACDYFFERKQQHNKAQDASYNEAISLKEAIILELESFDEQNPHTAIERLKEIQRRWSESGFVPSRIQNPLYSKYKEIIDMQFNRFKRNLSQLNLDNFKHKVSNSSSHTEMSRERDRLQKRLQKLESDILTLENNIGFFSKSNNANSLIKDVEQKIELSKEEAKIVKEKIRHIINAEKNISE